MSQYQVLKGQSPLRTWIKVLPILVVLSAAFCPPVAAIAQTIPNGAAIDIEVKKVMTDTLAKGIALAVIDHGKDGLSVASRAEITKPRLHITTAHQFPLFLPDLPVGEQRKDLYAGLGVVVFDGPQGHGFYKGGHDGQTANAVVCIEAGQRCVVILSNDVRSEAGFAELVRFLLGDTGVPMTGNMGTTQESREFAPSGRLS